MFDRFAFKKKKQCWTAWKGSLSPSVLVVVHFRCFETKFLKLSTCFHFLVHLYFLIHLEPIIFDLHVLESSCGCRRVLLCCSELNLNLIKAFESVHSDSGDFGNRDFCCGGGCLYDGPNVIGHLFSRAVQQRSGKSRESGLRRTVGDNSPSAQGSLQPLPPLSHSWAGGIYLLIGWFKSTLLKRTPAQLHQVLPQTLLLRQCQLFFAK